jgi:putative alpha-1,2-mannosidase
VTIDLGQGKSFEIVARNASAQNKYIQSAILNGKKLDAPWISHQDIIGGGDLVFEMGPRANKKWGSFE